MTPRRMGTLVLVLSLWPAVAAARATSAVPYSVAEAFSTGLRYVRVDRGCKIVDKDAEAAFITFECKDDDKVKRGSMEIWKSPEGAHLQVTLGDDPRYVELRFLELWERKLKDERGHPPSVSIPSKPAPSDGGAP